MTACETILIGLDSSTTAYKSLLQILCKAKKYFARVVLYHNINISVAVKLVKSFKLVSREEHKNTTTAIF